MADWPKAISPENRIEYLIDARREVKDGMVWTPRGPTEGYHGKFEIWDIYVENNKGNWEALIIETQRADDDHEYGLTPYPMGLFRDKDDARRALIDHVVVTVAVRQAWEDVAG